MNREKGGEKNDKGVLAKKTQLRERERRAQQLERKVQTNAYKDKGCCVG